MAFVATLATVASRIEETNTLLREILTELQKQNASTAETAERR